MDITLSLHDTIEELQDRLRDISSPDIDWQFIHDRLDQLAETAQDISRPELAHWIRIQNRLVDLAHRSQALGVPSHEVQGLGEFLRESLNATYHQLVDDHPDPHRLESLRDQVRLSWADCLDDGDVFEPTGSTSWPPALEDSHTSEVSEHSDETSTISPTQIDLILQQLRHESGATATPDELDPLPSSSSPPTPTAPPRPILDTSVPSVGPPLTTALHPALEDMTLEPELLEAYLDDGQHCLAAIEAALLAFENDPSQRGALTNVCRELHTLKGASASVGLHSLAHYLHDVEDALQISCDSGGPIDVQPILSAVDLVRQQMARCGQPDVAPHQVSPAPTGSNDPLNSTGLRDPASRPVSPSPERFVDSGAAGQDYVRVKSSQLDRLLDMLAELVMLRNRRESRVERLRAVHTELVRCVSRLRAYDESSNLLPLSVASGAATSTPTSQRVSSLTEIANDLLEVGSVVRELYEPFSEENLALSRFIRQFRQELVQLRRVPIGGLFQRLQRAVRDAARAEDKSVRVLLLGEDVGLETALQQQLFEPLLHVVRNSVSHGIEPESVRRSQGKAPVGTVTMEAQGSSNLLVISVRDDGGGLDYEALRRRGLEKGLLAPHQATSRSDLARLIFHPGFSTRTSANQVSGRGVGMDVVATAVERMHGWIEVDSQPGQGTTIRLLIPLQSVIEHVMVFRAGGQEFAIPTQNVEAVFTHDGSVPNDLACVELRRLFPQLAGDEGVSRAVIVLTTSEGVIEDESSEGGSSRPHPRTANTPTRIGLLIDEIVGPEEVVVRSLPALLQRQKLFSGITLAGTGDIMLLFHSAQLWSQALRAVQASPAAPREVAADLSSQREALVADDSCSARRLLSKLLIQRGFAVTEATDGMHAARLLKEQTFDIVFTDLEMPRMGGLELLREIRLQSHTAHLPVMIVSSRAEESFRQSARELGVTEYLVKPIHEASLEHALSLSGQSTSRSTE